MNLLKVFGLLFIALLLFGITISIIDAEKKNVECMNDLQLNQRVACYHGCQFGPTGSSQIYWNCTEYCALRYKDINRSK